jgi:hypothetical protein
MIGGAVLIGAVSLILVPFLIWGRNAPPRDDLHIPFY